MKETWLKVSAAEKAKLPANSESIPSPVTELKPGQMEFVGKQLDLINFWQ